MSNAFSDSIKTLFLLLWDEFKGYAKSKTIIALWIGVPILVIVIHFLTPLQRELPVTRYTGLVLAITGGVLASVTLGTTMTNEITKNVYALFLIRPVKRWQIVLSKYLAMMFSLLIAALLTFALGITIDSINFAEEIAATPDFILNDILSVALEDVVISLSAMSVACVIGLFMGMISRSVAMSAILSFYLGQQISGIAIFPRLLQLADPVGFTLNPLHLALGVGSAATVVILSLGIWIFYRKQF